MVYNIAVACRHHGEQYAVSNGHNKKWISTLILGVIAPAIIMTMYPEPYSNFVCKIILGLIWAIIFAYNIYLSNHASESSYSAPGTLFTGIGLWVLYLFAGVFNPAIMLFGGNL
jgi:uncharacterized membrane protein YeaQ/YmgE (transglycosylase-associated protein family)